MLSRLFHRPEQDLGLVATLILLNSRLAIKKDDHASRSVADITALVVISIIMIKDPNRPVNMKMIAVGMLAGTLEKILDMFYAEKPGSQFSVPKH